MTRYSPTHHRQYDSPVKRTRSSGCTWTSGAIGADASTGGRIDPSPDVVLSKVTPSEETNPKTPGWSLADLDRAMQRLGVPFVVRQGQGWAGVRAARKAGMYLVLQGDSDRFPGGCSGVFDGDHAIGVRPDDEKDGKWAIDDPICTTKTYQPESVLRAYAEKFAPGVSFGAFTTPVPPGLPDTDTEPPAMKLTDPVALSGTAVITAPDGYYLWRVSDDTKTKVLPKGTKFDHSVLGRARYHARADQPKGWPGLLVPYQGELHVLPEGLKGDIATFYDEPTSTEAFNLGVEAAAKAAASAKR